ncbi:MAG: flagellar hook-length control protein FliK [Planctomycetota bacterium]
MATTIIPLPQTGEVANASVGHGGEPTDAVSTENVEASFDAVLQQVTAAPSLIEHQPLTGQTSGFVSEATETEQPPVPVAELPTQSDVDDSPLPADHVDELLASSDEPVDAPAEIVLFVRTAIETADETLDQTVDQEPSEPVIPSNPSVESPPEFPLDSSVETPSPSHEIHEAIPTADAPVTAEPTTSTVSEPTVETQPHVDTLEKPERLTLSPESRESFVEPAKAVGKGQSAVPDSTPAVDSVAPVAETPSTEAPNDAAAEDSAIPVDPVRLVPSKTQDANGTTVVPTEQPTFVPQPVGTDSHRKSSPTPPTSTSWTRTSSEHVDLEPSTADTPTIETATGGQIDSSLVEASTDILSDPQSSNPSVVLEALDTHQPAADLSQPPVALVETPQTPLAVDSPFVSSEASAVETQAGLTSVRGETVYRSLPGGMGEQVVAAVHQTLNSGEGSTEKAIFLELQPPELGRLRIRVEQGIDSIATHIVASEASSGDLLSSRRDTLQDALSDLGFGEASVDISSSQDGSSFADEEFGQRDYNAGPHRYPRETDLTREVNDSHATDSGLNIIA